MKKIIALITATLMLLCVACGCASNAGKTDDTSTWPAGDVTVYIPSNAGDPVDLSARLLMQYLSEKTGVTFIPVNDATGDGLHALELVRNAKPDGSTLYFSGVANLIVYQKGVYQYDLCDTEQFTICGPMIGQVNTGSCWMTQPDAPYNTLQEMVDYIKAHPGEVTMATSSGNVQEVKVKLMTDYFGISDDVKFVQAKNNDLTVGLLNDSINVGLLGEATATQYVQEGTMKALANNSVVRAYGEDATLDAIPNYADLGLEELDFYGPMFVLAPGGMDDSLAQQICDAINSMNDSQEYLDAAIALGRNTKFVPYELSELRDQISKCNEQIASIYKG